MLREDQGQVSRLQDLSGHISYVNLFILGSTCGNAKHLALNGVSVTSCQQLPSRTTTPDVRPSGYQKPEYPTSAPQGR